MLIPTDSISSCSGLAVRNCVEPRVSWGWSRYFNKYFTPQVTNVPIIPAYVLKLTISWAGRVSCGHTKHWTVQGQNILDIFVLFKNIFAPKIYPKLSWAGCDCGGGPGGIISLSIKKLAEKAKSPPCQPRLSQGPLCLLWQPQAVREQLRHSLPASGCHRVIKVHLGSPRLSK